MNHRQELAASVSRDAALLRANYIGVVLAIAIMAGWIALSATLNHAQFSDSIEQFNWGHSFEWGYWKHPPLPTWLMWIAQQIDGVRPWHSYALAAACYAATAWFTWKLACLLLPREAAVLALLLWPLHHGLSWRAQIYNHNTVLLMTASAMTWAAVLAVRSGRLRHWALAGVLAGLGMLTKYQALVPIAAIVVALAITGALRDRTARKGLLLATFLASAVFAPHLLWAASRDFPTLGYLSASAGASPSDSLVMCLLHFMVVQVGMHTTMLLAVGILLLLPPRGAVRVHRAAIQNRWLLALIGVPVLILVVAVLAGGFRPQKFWGMQTLQFLPLALAAWLHMARPQLGWERPAIATVALSLAAGALAIHDGLDRGTWPKTRSQDTFWPAQELADRVSRDWHAATACALQYVVGPPLPAGLVAAYSEFKPVVIEDGSFAKTPWVTGRDIDLAGSVEIFGPVPESQIPAGLARMRVPTREDQGQPQAVFWKIELPAGHGCAPFDSSAG
jgi:4-amino-4-deoxy-L-arabinose transferase-like glycosyltransferase